MPTASQDAYLKDASGQFDVARKRASQQSEVNKQGRKDALTRRFASLGNLDSGARIKMEQKADDEESANLFNAQEGIDAAQNAEMARRRDVIQGQDFASGEAEKGRGFMAGESALGRQYGTSEREAGQDFASGEREAGQTFASGERVAGQRFASGEASKTRALQRTQFNATLAQGKDALAQAAKQFAETHKEDIRVNDANISFGQQTLDKKGFLDKLMGDGGGAFNNFNTVGVRATMDTLKKWGIGW